MKMIMKKIIDPFIKETKNRVIKCVHRLDPLIAISKEHSQKLPARSSIAQNNDNGTFHFSNFPQFTPRSPGDYR